LKRAIISIRQGKKTKPRKKETSEQHNQEKTCHQTGDNQVDTHAVIGRGLGAGENLGGEKKTPQGEHTNKQKAGIDLARSGSKRVKKKN